MKCKRHASDSSHRVGVCASCLRERLSALVSCQNEPLTAAAAASASAEERLRQPDPLQPQPPPHLAFPRSVSPYVSHRMSDRRFFSTPQVGPTTAVPVAEKRKRGKFSMFGNIFRSSRPRKPRQETHDAAESYPSSSSTSSPMWFSSAIYGVRKKSPRQDTCAGARSPWSTGGYWLEALRTPTRGRSGSSRSVANLAICLSPLVRASPVRRRAPEGGFSGEIRVATATATNKPRPPQLRANRSRKLADFRRPGQSGVTLTP